MDRSERLDYADRWLMDAFRELGKNPPGFTLYLDVEMTRSRELMERMKQGGVRGSYSGILLRAAALALVRHPELHQIISKTRRLWPGQVDIGLSVANEACAAPVLRLLDAGQTPLPQICEMLRVRVPELRQEDSKILGQLRRWGWLLPTGFLRRLALKVIFGVLGLRRKLAGSLQVTVLANVDIVVPYLFSTPAVLAMGRVADRVVARDGQPAVRLMAMLSCTADHKVWDGHRASIFLAEVGRILESGELLTELGEKAAPTAAPEPRPSA